MAPYLLTIKAVREKCTPVFERALADNLVNFDTHFTEANVSECVSFIVSLIKRDFGSDLASIPPHGRWQHLEAGGVPRVAKLVELWSSQVDDLEITRRLVDLFLLSVLLDAGAGNDWKFTEPDSTTYVRSEGLAVASYYAYVNGGFSTDPSNPFAVSAKALMGITETQFNDWMQVGPTNPLAGAKGRLLLLQGLGGALSNNKELFGDEGRPGAIVDYLKLISKDGELDLADLWDALISGFNGIWSSRLVVNGVLLGDAWRCKSVADIAAKQGKTSEEDGIVPFHKLTQWLTYSLLVPLQKYGHFKLKNTDLLTGLPEYRNGGLLLDFGLLSLKKEVLERGLQASKELGTDPSVPTYKPDDDVIVEWRCCTVGLLDYLLPLVNRELDANLELPQLIEAGSWKAGREIAAKKRPDTKGPPIALDSDGTVF